MTSVIEFIKTDFLSGLFPLKTNLLVAIHCEKELNDYIYQKVLDKGCHGDSFLSQKRVFATKPKGHLRRTVKLDPVAEYYIYDFVYRNRNIFRGQVSDKRKTFGYRFQDGHHIPVHIAYKDFKASYNTLATSGMKCISFDIASYFNTLYHHDISHWFDSFSQISDSDKAGIGQYFREINSGRSIDFLPQGIFPTKMIGNEFLKFIDLSHGIKANTMIRFMDDFHLFDASEEVLLNDFYTIQKLLGSKGLNVNNSKTYIGNPHDRITDSLAKISNELMQVVTKWESIPTPSGIDYIETSMTVEGKLTTEQAIELISLLKSETLDESDAELILAFLREHSDQVLEIIPMLLVRFPNIIKHLYTVCGKLQDKEAISQIFLDYISSETLFLEYQLFWMAAIAEDFLAQTSSYGQLLFKLFEASSEYHIARAKILETPESRFGLKEIRSEYLKTGQSDWLSWSSAMGTRNLNPSERNYALDYFSKGSSINYLIASAVKKL